MEETEEDIVMVKIKRKTRDRLKALGKKGDTYEDIISKSIGNIGAINKIEFIAAIRHIGWVTYQIAAGQHYNEKINVDQRESLIDGVQFMLMDPDITPKENHDNWAQQKQAQGWVYGEVKDFEKKTHPDLVPYDQLPEIEKRKDVADSTSHRLGLELWGALQESLATRKYQYLSDPKDLESEKECEKSR